MEEDVGKNKLRGKHVRLGEVLYSVALRLIEKERRERRNPPYEREIRAVVSSSIQQEA